jgi:hypothetical protein
MIHSDLRDLALILRDEGVYTWHLLAISVANAANLAITSVTQTTGPNGSSIPTSNQSGRWSTVSRNAFGSAHAVYVAEKFKKPFSSLLKILQTAQQDTPKLTRRRYIQKGLESPWLSSPFSHISARASAIRCNRLWSPQIGRDAD